MSPLSGPRPRLAGSAYSPRRAVDTALVERSLRDARPVPYWTDALTAPAPGPALRGEARADLVVVGGGYCGLWTALLAKERDPQRDVVVLEARRTGWAASSRNGGFCEASLTHGAYNGRQRFAGELERIARLERENFQGLRDTLDRYSMDVGFEPSGVLTVATENHQVVELRAAAGEHAQFLDAEQVRQHVRSPLVRAGLFKSDGYALVDPARLVAELRRVCLQLGVRIHEASPVTGMRRSGGRVLVRTAGGVVSASRVALATNGFPALVRRARHLTLPVYDYVLMTEPLTDEQLAATGWTARFGLTDCGRQFHYSRKTADNRILWGGYDAVHHRGGRIVDAHDQRPETFRVLADHFFRVFPSLRDVRFTHAWGGMIDMSTRLVSTQGTSHGGAVAYSVGYTGLGVAATRFGAAVMLDLLDGVASERSSLRLATGRPFPVPGEPLVHPVVEVVRRAVARADERGGRPGPVLSVLRAAGIDFGS